MYLKKSNVNRFISQLTTTLIYINYLENVNYLDNFTEDDDKEQEYDLSRTICLLAGALIVLKNYLNEEEEEESNLVFVNTAKADSFLLVTNYKNFLNAVAQIDKNQVDNISSLFEESKEENKDLFFLSVDEKSSSLSKFLKFNNLELSRDLLAEAVFINKQVQNIRGDLNEI